MTAAKNGKYSVLLVAQIAPPSSLVAARRVAAMAKYLGRAGYPVTTLASIASGDGEIEGAEAVVRTKDALTSGLNWRRRQFAALAGSSAGSFKPPSRLASIVVPDLSLATWLPFALPAALRLERTRRFDCVLTTSPAASTHLVGLALRRRGLPWIAELRDGWTFEPPRAPWPLQVQRKLDLRLERRVLTRADAAVGVTRPIVEDLRQRLALDAILITNGYDPEDLGSEQTTHGPPLEADRHLIVHTGRLSTSGVSLRPMLEGLRIVKSEDPEAAARLRLVFAGSLTEEQRRLLAAPDLSGMVHFVGWLERPSALALQRAADTLLVVTEGAGRRSVATGKLYEYLLARRPVLVLGEETEAARIVAETRTGFATSSTDPRAIAGALRRLVDRNGLLAPDEDALRRYSWTSLAEQYAVLIEHVCSGRRATK